MEGVVLCIGVAAPWGAAATASAVAVALAAAGVATAIVVQRRLVYPARVLADVVERAGDGDGSARAELTGDHRLARVGRALDSAFDRLESVSASARARQAEARSQALQLREAHAFARLGTWRYDPDTDAAEFSDAFHRIVGIDPDDANVDEAPLDRMTRLVHPDDLEVMDSLKHALRTVGTDARGRLRLTRGNGSHRLIDIGGRWHVDAERGSSLFAGIVQDVTHHVTRRQLIDEQLRLIDIAGSVAEFGGWDVDVATGELSWSKKVYDIHEVPRGEAISLDEAFGFIADEHRETIRSHYQCTLSTGQPFDAAFVIESRTGRRKWVRTTGRARTGDGGRLEGVHGVLQDISKTVAVQEALDEQRRLMDLAGEVARFGSWSVDLVNDDVTWSKHVYDIYELPYGMRTSVEEGMSYYAPEHREALRAAFDEAIEAGGSFDLDLEIISARGTRKWVHVMGQAVVDASRRQVVAIHGAVQDIDERKRLESETVRLEHTLRATLESVSDSLVVCDRELRVEFANATARALTPEPAALEEDDLELARLLPRAIRDTTIARVREAMRTGESARFEAHETDGNRWFEIWIDATERGALVGLHDVTLRRSRTDRLVGQEEELTRQLALRQSLINAIPSCIAVVDGDGTVVLVNDRWRTFGIRNGASSDFVGTNYLDVCDADEGGSKSYAASVAQGLRSVLSGRATGFRTEYPCSTREQELWFDVEVAPLETVGAPGGAVVVHSDITERRTAEHRMERMTFEDRLTGQHSRLGLLRELEEWIDVFGWPRGGVVAAIDLVDLSGVNESHGFDVGDALLIEIGKRLGQDAARNAFVARTGGDSFAVFVLKVGAVDSVAARLAMSADGSFREPFRVAGLRLDMAAHVGYTRLGDRVRPVEDVLREAELALHASEFGTRRNVTEYDDKLERVTLERVQLTSELRSALRDGEFELHYQPKVVLASGKMVGAEALIRWNHPTRGLLSPGSFIEVAESGGLIVSIGAWVLEEACARLRVWQDNDLDVVSISVNVSVQQLVDHDFVEVVEAALDRHGIAASAVTIEITENVFMSESSHLREQLGRLQDLGVRIALDDFGTGYSSLAYLQAYDFDEIKVDRRFAADLQANEYNRSIVEAIVGIAGALGVDVVVEGVETAAEGEIASALGCVFGQGYYFSIPLVEEDFRWLLEHAPSLPVEAV